MPDHTTKAQTLLDKFAAATGLSSGAPARRYLWTDAFAVCGFLELHRRLQEQCYLDLALHLVDAVHSSLGRHREDDPREGWISGLSDVQGAQHPTAGGLRIGKPESERGPDEPYDRQQEWDRDGQYFHYLTKWMQALQRTRRVTQQPRFGQWAEELAVAAHEAFVYAPRHGGGRRMYWKMSIDLSRPLVPSMGQHDPLDGYLTCLELSAADGRSKRLSEAVHSLGALCNGRSWATTDPLGLGGLLVDVARVVQLQGRDLVDGERLDHLLDQLLGDVAHSLTVFARSFEPDASAEHRLAFRELGLSLGLAALDALVQDDGPLPSARDPEVQDRLQELARHTHLRTAIERFWLDPQHHTRTWQAHADINTAMLAVSLAPDTYLHIA